MEISFILFFFLTVPTFGLLRKWKDHNKSENIFYISTIAISLAVLLLKSLDLLPFNPVMNLTELFDALGLLPKL